MYDVWIADTIVNRKGGVTIGNSERFPYKEDPIPGPGTYKVLIEHFNALVQEVLIHCLNFKHYKYLFVLVKKCFVNWNSSRHQCAMRRSAGRST